MASGGFLVVQQYCAQTLSFKNFGASDPKQMPKWIGKQPADSKSFINLSGRGGPPKARAKLFSDQKPERKRRAAHDRRIKSKN